MAGESPKLPCPKGGAELLDMYYLEIRSHLLEAGAILDRLERSPDWESIKDDPRLQKLRGALDVLAEPGADRTERFLNSFSV